MYSYGILLLELFSAKRPTDDMFKDSLNIHNFVKMALPGDGGVAEALDPVLVQEIVEKEDTQRQQSSKRRDDDNEGCLVSIFQVGVACSAEFPGQRMSINDAAAELVSVRKILLGNGTH